MNNVILTAVAMWVATAALQGCKHPLAIEGQGDIVDLNRTGHGCTHTQFQAGDPACTENEVRGDYHVNYKAKPGPGWRFVRWEGPCAPASNFQKCRLDLSASQVAWWDENYPDQEIPASTAVFQRISGETGFLLAPGAVTGVSYETPTQKGVTGLDGSFQYDEGETVRFSIGDTVLGEATGQRQLTPFDLAGSEVLTGIRINWALQDGDSPFQAVINLAVLLQSLDQDANAGNGIQIRQGVSALFHGFSLDVTQDWRTFQGDSRLRHALGTASRTRRFSKPHGIIKPAPAASYLYEGLGIDARTVGISQKQVGEQGEFLAYTEYFHYDTDGNMTRHDDGTSNAFETWEYSPDGNVIRHERDAKMYIGHDIEFWKYDSRGNLVRHEQDVNADGTIDGTEFWRYNSNNNIVAHGYGRADYEHGNVDHLSYDDRGNLIRRESTFGDGDLSAVSPETRRYDASGRLVQSTGEFSLGSDEPAGSSTSWTYDSSGKLRQITQSAHGPYGSASTTEIWKYNNQGKVISKKLVNDDGTVDRAQTWEYDNRGNMTRYESDGAWCEAGHPAGYTVDFEIADHCTEGWQYHSNGTVSLQEINATLAWRRVEPPLHGNWQFEYDSSGRMVRYESQPYEYADDFQYWTTAIVNWQYDNSGNLTRKVVDLYADGTADHSETWQYEADGNLRRFDAEVHRPTPEYPAFESSISFRYATTGWGHLFSNSSAGINAVAVPLKPEPDPLRSYQP